MIDLNKGTIFDSYHLGMGSVVTVNIYDIHKSFILQEQKNDF